MRAVRLLTLGFRMFSVFAAMRPPPRGRAFAYGSFGERSSESDARERVTSTSIASARCTCGDVVVAALDAELVRLEQHVGVGEAERRLEAVRRELDQQPERVLEVDRVHEAAVLDAAVLDPALVEPLHRLVEGRLRERERDVVHAAGVGRRARRVGRRAPRW